MRALRNRRLSDELVPLPDVIRNAPVRLSGRSTDDQVQSALVELRSIGFALLRLGVVARPDLAWRCTRLGEAVESALEETFGKAME